MADPGSGAPQTADWLQPPVESEGLSRYVATLRERLWLVLLVLVITTGIAIFYVVTATKIYEAQADIRVVPIPAGETNFQGLPLIFESSDPTRDVTTASALVTSVAVAERVAEETGLSEDDPGALLEDVTAEPVAQSQFVAIVAQSPVPADAAALANGFAEQVVIERTARLREAIDKRLATLETQLAAGKSEFIEARIAELEELRAGGDPTIQVETEAAEPGTPVSPRPTLSLAAGILAGLILGAAAAFAAQGLDPRLRREEQLRRLYRLPVLARIPRETKRTPDRPLGPRSVSPAAGEAFRTLRGTVSMSRGETGSRAILVTGSSPSEGKSTTSINLAVALSATGRSVILIEADLRRPSVGRALAIGAKRGTVSVLIESVKLEDALIPSELGPNLSFLLADYEGGWISDLFALPSALQMIDDAKRLADYVIIDSPPLTDVVDTLPIARYADDVLIVVRPGVTRLNKLTQLGELLAENGVRPMGFAVVGVDGPSRGEKSYYTEQRESMLHRPPDA